MPANRRSTGWEESMVCTKCFRPLTDCPSCRQSRLDTADDEPVTCTTCHSTGYLCGRHEGRWQ